jgi:hypothetical protein
MYKLYYQAASDAMNAAPHQDREPEDDQSVEMDETEEETLIGAEKLLDGVPLSAAYKTC